MLFPVRCHTCNKAIGARYEKYEELVRKFRTDGSSVHTDEFVLSSTTTAEDINALMNDPKHQTPEYRALELLRIKRYCCRRHFLTEIDLINVCQRAT